MGCLSCPKCLRSAANDSRSTCGRTKDAIRYSQSDRADLQIQSILGLVATVAHMVVVRRDA